VSTTTSQKLVLADAACGAFPGYGVDLVTLDMRGIRGGRYMIEQSAARDVREFCVLWLLQACIKWVHFAQNATLAMQPLELSLLWKVVIMSAMKMLLMLILFRHANLGRQAPGRVFSTCEDARKSG